jgi:hypothetical protein
MEGGKEQNYWPGFVDALSNVVLTLIFVLVVFVFALVMSANKVEKKMQEVKQAEAAQKSEQAQLEKALSEMDQLRNQIAKTGSDKGATGPDTSADQQFCLKFSKSDESQKAEVDQNSKDLLITYSPNAISVTEQTTKSINDYLDNYRKEHGAPPSKIVIESSDDPTSSSGSLSREAELGRILNVRNTLLTGKQDPKAINVRSVTPIQQSGTYNWVKLHVE